MTEVTKQVAKKKPYVTPVLTRYGDLPTITQNVGSMTNPDGGTNPKVKTA